MSGPVTARSYHERTKHSLARFAAGPETVDWTSPPSPFRSYAGAARTSLPLGADSLTRPFHAPGSEDMAAAPSIHSIGALFELTFGISAWKQQGPDRWAVRCNPSSGNLHPTEGYLIARGVESLPDGLYHYEPLEHLLEQRRADAPRAGGPQLLVGMSSVHWREAWKYGERAFRYCQLDIGHALAGLHYAAALLGWRVRPLWSLSSRRVARLLGLDREQDFTNAEPEEPALIVSLQCSPASAHEATDLTFSLAEPWTGWANRLDPHPMYRWPIIDAVALQTRKGASLPQLVEPVPVRTSSERAEERCTSSAVQVIRGRRSAQRFDTRFVLSAARAGRLFEALLPRDHGPSAAAFPAAGVQVVALVQRVDGMSAGLYALPRSQRGAAQMREHFHPHFAWQSTPLPNGSAMYQLAEGLTASATRRMCCSQAIASDCNILFALLGELGTAPQPLRHRYRERHWEAGLLGQILYLEAQAMGLAGTGIGCFLDDELHGLLGMSGGPLQALYCFSVGLPLRDERLQTMPPYPPPAQAAIR